MSEVETSQVGSSRVVDEQDRDAKLVPVSESIRYRKRAQSAEKANEELRDELSQLKAKAGDVQTELQAIRIEQSLAKRLISEDVIDLEGAILLAKSKCDDSEDKDIDAVVAELKQDKQYLFANGDRNNSLNVKMTSGAKDNISTKQSFLERTARRAATSGSRIDLQEYLKVRRNYI